MISHANLIKPFAPNSSPHRRRRHRPKTLTPLSRQNLSGDPSSNRRNFILVPSICIAASSILHSVAAAKAEEKLPYASPATAAADVAAIEEKKKEEVISRVYDASVIGEPQAVGRDKKKVWEKLLSGRVVYLGEAELVPDKDDRELELEIVKGLRNRCLEKERAVSVAMEAFPANLQEQLDRFLDGRIDSGGLRAFTSHWPPQHWQEYEPLLNYCRDNGVKLVACGTPLEVLRTVQAEGIGGLSKAQRKMYAPPAGSDFISGFSSISRWSLIDKISSNQSALFGPSSYLSAQARVVDDYAMSQIILQAITDGGSSAMLIVITGASHVIYGSRGTGIPARISKKLQKKSQAVILLDP